MIAEDVTLAPQFYHPKFRLTTNGHDEDHPQLSAADTDAAESADGSPPMGENRDGDPTYGRRVAEDSSVPPFEGFPAAATEFYQQLTVHNSREFWNDHRDVYETAVRAPMLALTAEWTEEFGPFKIFRPHRDVRFSKDKTPYKTSQGAVTEGEGGEFYYFQINADGLSVATGYHYLARDQLGRFRQHVDNERTGERLVATVAGLEATYSIGGRALSTAPRGYPRDHPRIRFLQHKGLTAGRDFGTPDWLTTRRAKRHIAETWRGANTLNEWLNAHVGPSHLPPDDQ